MQSLKASRITYKRYTGSHTCLEEHLYVYTFF